MYTYIYIYIYKHIHICIHTYISTHAHRPCYVFALKQTVSIENKVANPGNKWAIKSGLRRSHLVVKSLTHGS